MAGIWVVGDLSRAVWSRVGLPCCKLLTKAQTAVDYVRDDLWGAALYACGQDSDSASMSVAQYGHLGQLFRAIWWCGGGGYSGAIPLILITPMLILFYLVFG